MKFCGCRWHPDCVGPTPLEKIEKILKDHNDRSYLFEGERQEELYHCEDTLMAIQMVVDKANE